MTRTGVHTSLVQHQVGGSIEGTPTQERPQAEDPEVPPTRSATC